MSDPRVPRRSAMSGEPLAGSRPMAAELPDGDSGVEEAARKGCLARLKRSALYNWLKLWRVRDSSERVARGFALGLIVNFHPTFGFGVLISGFVARLFGGNAIAGLIGGATLTLAWPLLFYLNVKVGSLAFPPKIRVEELEDVTERAVDALVWGKTFLVGAVVNSLVVGLLVYVGFRYAHQHLRPWLLPRLRRASARRRHRRLAVPSQAA